MIARIWHGQVPLEKSEAYLKHMQDVAIPEYKATPGNQGAWCLRRIDGDIAHFEMLTFWTDEQVIKSFAGDDIQQAKYYDFDAEYLLEFEPHVRHYKLYSV